MSKGRVAVVTGGGRGIGRGIILELAAQGYEVAVNFRSDESAAKDVCRLAMERGAPRAEAFAADVRDLGQGRSLVDRVFGSFGSVDVWVNNAGVAPLVRADVLDLEPESWDRVLDINLRGPFFVTQAVARRMLDQSRTDGEVAPMIVFITSVSSTFASVNRAEYCVSKAGLSMVAQLFAVRLAEAGLLIYEVRPGIIATDMTDAVHQVYTDRIAAGLTPIRRWGHPEDVGRAVAALAGGALRFSTGEVIHVDGGLGLRRL